MKGSVENPRPMLELISRQQAVMESEPQGFLLRTYAGGARSAMVVCSVKVNLNF